MKLTANGMELAIIRGGEKFIRSHKIKYILLTIDTRLLAFQGYKPDLVYITLASMNYRFRKDSF